MGKMQPKSPYMQPRAVRREARHAAGRLRSGKLVPVNVTAVRESEAAFIDQNITLELEPCPGRLITPVHAEVITVFVPALAIDAVKDPDADYPGNAEIFREKLLSGAPVFDLEPEGEISKRLKVNPRSIAGEKMVSEAVRYAHIAAVNYLRRRKYVDAVQLDNTSDAITPALLSSTALERLNGVLDPEDRINGAVSLKGSAPVKGLGLYANSSISKSRPWPNIHNNSGEKIGSDTGWLSTPEGTAPHGMRYFFMKEDPDNPGYPLVHVDLEDAGTELSLDDFYTAERMDALTRQLRQIVDDNPEHGQDIVSRISHGLHVEAGKQPFVLYRREVILNSMPERATDGPSLGTMSTNIMGSFNFSIPAPKTELGGIVMTFVSVKPDEKLASQPHPILSDVWAARNYIADELVVDPVRATVRDLYSDCDQADEGNTVMYVGNHGLMRTYVDYGFNRALNPADVENQTAIFQYEIPLSVTPESVLYPEDWGAANEIAFGTGMAEIVRYTSSMNSVVHTPIIFGPTPVEELAALDDENVFGDIEEGEE